MEKILRDPPLVAFGQVMASIACVLSVLALIVLFWQTIFGVGDRIQILMASILTMFVVSFLLNKVFERKELKRFKKFLSLHTDLRFTAYAVDGWNESPAGPIFGFQKGIVVSPVKPGVSFKTRDESAFLRMQRLLCKQ